VGHFAWAAASLLRGQRGFVESVRAAMWQTGAVGTGSAKHPFDLIAGCGSRPVNTDNRLISGHPRGDRNASTRGGVLLWGSDLQRFTITR